MQPQLREIIGGVASPEVAEILEGVFTDLNRLTGYLGQVKTCVNLGDSADGALFLLDIVRSEALAASAGLDSACESAGLPEELCEELGRTSFAIRHELKAVYGRTLAGLAALADPEDARARLADAHDLLRNCFQQSTISIARVFRPSLDGASLFEDIRVKRDNSLRLYEDLDALLRSARNAEWRGDEAAVSLFSERMELFRAESVQHLMQKDSETCLKFMDDFRTVAGRKAERLFLHRFSCYLEILLKHVGMRSVLADAAVSVAA